MESILDRHALEHLGRLNALRGEGIYTYSLPVSSACEREITVEGTPRINFISNNYLGFSTHPKVVEACRGALAKYGVGIGGSPLASGTTELHLKLKRRIAEVYGQEDAALFASGYQALLGGIQALIRPGDLAVLDALVHRSIVDGVRLSGSGSRSWLHNDLEDLAYVLDSTDKKNCRRLIVVDSVYSMDGDIADLKGLYELKKKHGALLMIDEAHALGVIGPNGGGLPDRYGMKDAPDSVAGTFSKFAGSVGGFVAGPADYIDSIQHSASPFVFSASVPPVIVAGVLAAFELLEKEPEVRERLWRNVKFLREGLQSLGFDTGKSETPVIPIILRDGEATMAFNRYILDHGVYASPVVYPGVAPTESRIRLGVMATHTIEDMERALEVFKEAGRRTLQNQRRREA